ncbi:MAG: hypothetical protein Q8K75_02720 [Chlamydiales bacterium]|nr:hypothetical protein [Chlamydiales bacterium]
MCIHPRYIKLFTDPLTQIKTDKAEVENIYVEKWIGSVKDLIRIKVPKKGVDDEDLRRGSG